MMASLDWGTEHILGRVHRPRTAQSCNRGGIVPRPAPDRRRFLGDLGARVATLALAPLPLAALARSERTRPALPPAGRTRPDEAYWALVRAQFPIRPGLIPLNAANLCPAPRTVIEAAQRAG